jgi:hypothetical protein
MLLKCSFRYLRVWMTITGWMVIQLSILAQTPVVTVRFTNPQNDCPTGEYCLDVEFKADIPDQEVFGMNVRFFYDDQILELIDFRDFQGGYGPVEPDPPIIFTSAPAGPALFNFPGPAEFINGAIQLVSTGPPPIYLGTDNYTKLFQICFEVDGPIPNLDTFCPAVVWDLEQDPANGGFLSGDDGVVITIVDPDPNNESYAANENVEQFNWEYIGNGSPPFGQPQEMVCSNINCALPVSLLFFKGKREGHENLLEWQASNEINLLGFKVQTSHDRASWSDIGFLEPSLENSFINTYHFTDQNPIQGNNYYRLDQMDLDGKHFYSSIINVPVSNSIQQLGLTIQPNPVSDGQLSIQLSEIPKSGMLFRLMASTGDLVRETFLDSPVTVLDVSGLPSGVYVAIVTSDSQQLVKKLIISK